MKRKLFRGVAVGQAVWALAAGGAVHGAAVDFFLKLDGVEGESADAAHAKWVDVASVQWGLSKPGATNPAVSMGLQLSKRLDASSSTFSVACAEGRRFPKATLDLVHAGARRVRLMRVLLEDVLVVQSGAVGAEAEAVLEQVALSFAKMSWSYTEFDRDSRPVREWGSYWDFLSGAGGASVRDAMKVTGVPDVSGGQFKVSFPVEGGTTYRIMGGADPAGPFSEVRRFTAGATGGADQSLPVVGGPQFFYVEEVP